MARTFTCSGQSGGNRIFLGNRFQFSSRAYCPDMIRCRISGERNANRMTLEMYGMVACRFRSKLYTGFVG